jgi:hypothetical protein
MIIVDMVVILTVMRGVILDSSLKTDELKKLLGNVTEDEKTFITSWNNYLQQIDISQYHYYEPDDVKKYLEIKYNIRFPIANSYITKANLRKNYILLYYKYMGFDINRYDINFNDEQIECIRTSNGITVVNAGPGTGKTTTACRKAFEYNNEGVIFISYTNAAVNDDKNKMFSYPMTTSLLSGKKYVFSTIDSIAGTINGGISQSYDHSIRDAIERIRNNNTNFAQKHIIVDEAQDIDELRSDFIFSLFFFGRFKSLTIFGDPRQKIKENAGRWYTNLWIHSETNNTFSYNFNRTNLKRIGFTISHRFKNKQILDLVNSLSARRPNIHCELKIKNESINNYPIITYNISNNNQLAIMTEICNFIMNKHINEKVPFSEFMVVGPSLDSDNQTSKLSKMISSFFRNFGIPCKLQSEGNYEASGVLFSTIQSIKGKECDYLFLFGFNNYPNSFSMIPYEEAESLNFVSHSRARMFMIYINNVASMLLPRGIKEEHVYITENSNVIQVKEKEIEQYSSVNKKSVTSLVKCFDFTKLMESNNLTVSANKFNLVFPLLQIHDNISSDYFGILIGIGVQIQCERKLPKFYLKFMANDYVSVTNSIYNEIKKKDDFINGIDSNNIMYIKESPELAHIKSLLTKINTNIETMNNNDYYILTTLSVYIGCGIVEEYEVNNNFDYHNYFISVAYIIKTNFGDCVGTEVSVFFNLITGSIDIITTNYIIELKTKQKIENIDILQTMLYKSLCLNETLIPVLINLRLNECYYIESNRIYEYWRYLIEKYDQIREQVNYVRYHTSKNKNIEFANNSFCIDTEFNCNTSEIFEIGIFNINDPYRSIIQTVNCSIDTLNFALTWLPYSKKMYETSPSFSAIDQMFKNLIYLYDQKPTLFYYMATADVKWCNYATLVDVGKYTKEIASKSGTFKSRTCSPKLIDYYNNHVDFINHHAHLKHHTALSDCLMLYSILKIKNKNL